MKTIQTIVLILLYFLISINVVDASGDLSVSGATITEELFIADLDCSSGANGGALTADNLGEVICADATVLQADASSCISGGVPGTVVSGFGAGGVFRVSCFRRSVTTLAGSTAGFADGAGADAQFDDATGVALDGAGNVYVADSKNHRIRKITPGGIVSTLAGSTAGSADGTGAAAHFDTPRDVAVDGAGNVYVADTLNNRIRKVTPAGIVTTLAGSTAGFANGAGAAAQFVSPTGVALDGAGNVYVADQGNHMIRRVTPAGLVSTLAGNGTQGFADGIAADAQFRFPAGLALDGAGNVYVADKSNQRIRKISTTGFTFVTSLAGSGVMGFADGLGATAQFQFPVELAIDGAGNVYVADLGNNRIRKITTPAGVVTTVAGSTGGYVDGVGAAARFIDPDGVAVDEAGSVIYVADGVVQDHRIRRIR